MKKQYFEAQCNIIEIFDFDVLTISAQESGATPIINYDDLTF